MTSAESLELMQHPENWPRWPHLPVKRYQTKDGTKVAGGMEVAVMFASALPIVYLVPFYELQLGKPINQYPSIKYNTWEELIADGWIVD